MSMTRRQCEIAAEAYAASLLARSGYDVSVQYGANQPGYDLVAVKDNRILLVSVKGSQAGGWMLASKYVKNANNYLEAIDLWRCNQRQDLVYFFIQYSGCELTSAPATYIAKCDDIATHLKSQFNGRGSSSLQEDYRKIHPNSKYDHKIPSEWAFTQVRIDNI